MTTNADIVILGAGIAGVSAAYHLAVKHKQKNILLVDERSPLTLTSDHSTECYRNWWPGPDNAMVALMNRSINLMDELAHESGNAFNLNRRGYLYLSANSERIPEIIEQASQVSLFGGGPLRIHRSQPGEIEYQPQSPEEYKNQPDGADLILDRDIFARHFPYLADDVVAGLHVRRAGWFSAQQLGMYFLVNARRSGVQYHQARITEITIDHAGVRSVKLSTGEQVHTRCLVVAAGPMLNEIGIMLGVELPVYCELHQKVAFKDTEGTIDRDSPLLIWTDPQRLSWTQEEQDMLAEDASLTYLLDEMPPGVHTRPEGSAGSQNILMLWEYRTEKLQPIWPIPLDPAYPDIVLRGLSRMIPGLKKYFLKAPKPQMDGGYYIKTRENRPIIGNLPIKGAYVYGALSGFGLMTSSAGGELLAACIMKSDLPEYAGTFSLSRYEDPVYIKRLEDWGATGQL